MASETEQWLARGELSENIRAAWKVGLEVEDPSRSDMPRRVFGRWDDCWHAADFADWVENRQFTRFYAFVADLPVFVEVA